MHVAQPLDTGRGTMKTRGFVPGKLYQYTKAHSVMVLEVLEAGVERFRCLVVTSDGNIINRVMWAEDWEEINP